MLWAASGGEWIDSLPDLFPHRACPLAGFLERHVRVAAESDIRASVANYYAQNPASCSGRFHPQV
jgi:hypothetical protein